MINRLVNITLILATLLSLCSCNIGTKGKSDTDIFKKNLRGNVKSVRLIYYDAINSFKGVEKGEITDYVWENVKMTYDEDGFLSAQSYFYSDGSLCSTDSNILDDTKKITSTKKFYPDSTMYEVTRYSHDEGGHSVKWKRINKEKTTNGRWVYSYGENGKPSEQKKYTGKNRLDKSYKYTYDEKNRLIGTREYLTDGTLNWESKFKYDDHDNIREHCNYDSYGMLNTRVSFDYSDYDEENNWRYGVVYRQQGKNGSPIPSAIINRTIEYY